MAKNKLIFSFYNANLFNLRSELNIKQGYIQYDYISPYMAYPKIQISKTLKRNGLRGSFRGLRPVEVIKTYLTYRYTKLFENRKI